MTQQHGRQQQSSTFKAPIPNYIYPVLLGRETRNPAQCQHTGWETWLRSLAMYDHDHPWFLPHVGFLPACFQFEVIFQVTRNLHLVVAVIQLVCLFGKLQTA